MSDFYQYQFESPEPLLALVKEELKSYIDTGAIDDSIWSIYIDKCLKKLGKGSYSIDMAILNLCDYQARLPDNFYAVREAWLCTDVSKSYQLPNADYEQVKVQSTSTLLSSNAVYCSPCDNCNTPDVIRAVYKTTHTVFAHYQKQYLLKPGTIWAKGQCSANCLNFGSAGPESFDIRDNKFVVTFPHGTVYMLYYSKEYDDNGYQLIPDDFRIKEYIEAFIKQKVFEQLCNQTTDETYNQVEAKAQKYKAMADEAFIMAQIEAKKETIYKKRQKIIQTYRRFDKYYLPDQWPNNRM